MTTPTPLTVYATAAIRRLRLLHAASDFPPTAEQHAELRAAGYEARGAIADAIGARA